MINKDKLTKLNPLVSIIIRTKNEERWISSCLRSVFNQSYKNIEVIIVDNCSTDETLRRIEEFDIKVINIKEFIPGKAINDGIRASKGDYIVCLSGHCVPTNDKWLENLVKDLSSDNVAGVYGRQEPLSFTSDLDKRDLLTVFGLDKKIQKQDYFFHNANSAFTRTIWEKYNFDETVTNIEDRVWGKQVIEDGLNIIYEPKASVYHWHGINHDLNPERARKIVRILESLDEKIDYKNQFEIDKMNIIAIIPIRGKSTKINNKYLLEYTIKAVKKSSLVKHIIVSTDDIETQQLAKDLGASAPFIRPKNLSEDYIDIKDVLKYTLEKVDDVFKVPDLVVALEETCPFRPPQLIDSMIRHLIEDGLDSVIATKQEMRGLLLDNNGSIEQIAEGLMPRVFKNTKAMIALTGLACVTHSSFIRNGEILGRRLGVYEVNDHLSSEEIRDNYGIQLAEQVLDTWWTKYYA